MNAYKRRKLKRSYCTKWCKENNKTRLEYKIYIEKLKKKNLEIYSNLFFKAMKVHNRYRQFVK